MYYLDEKLDDLAWDMGVEIVTTAHLSQDFNTHYYHPERLIFVRTNLDLVTRRCAVTHELGHAHFEDDCSTTHAETRAD